MNWHISLKWLSIMHVALKSFSKDYISDVTFICVSLLSQILHFSYSIFNNVWDVNIYYYILTYIICVRHPCSWASKFYFFLFKTYFKNSYIITKHVPFHYAFHLHFAQHWMRKIKVKTLFEHQNVLYKYEQHEFKFMLFFSTINIY
jgi:hypothetical protein